MSKKRPPRADRAPLVVFKRPVNLVVQAVRRYAAYHDVLPKVICNRALETSSTSKYWTRLNCGKVTIRTVEQLVDYLSGHWPEGLAWPEGLVRPEKPITNQRRRAE